MDTVKVHRKKWREIVAPGSCGPSSEWRHKLETPSEKKKGIVLGEG